MATGYNDTHRYKNYIVEDTISVYPAMYPTWLNYAFFVHPDTQIQEIRNRINCIRITDTKPLMFWIDYLCATGSTLQPDQLATGYTVYPDTQTRLNHGFSVYPDTLTQELHS